MTVIGYVVQCQRCGARMVVTADARTATLCPDCLTVSRLDDPVDPPADGDHIPPWQVHG